MHVPCSFAPFGMDPEGHPTLREFYAGLIRGRNVLLADDVRNTGQTLERAASLVRRAGGRVLAAAVICDRMESIVGSDVPLVPLVEYAAPENYPVDRCPLCTAGVPITTF